MNILRYTQRGTLGLFGEPFFITIDRMLLWSLHRLVVEFGLLLGCNSSCKALYSLDCVAEHAFISDTVFVLLRLP